MVQDFLYRVPAIDFIPDLQGSEGFRAFIRDRNGNRFSCCQIFARPRCRQRRNRHIHGGNHLQQRLLHAACIAGNSENILATTHKFHIVATGIGSDRDPDDGTYGLAYHVEVLHLRPQHAIIINTRFQFHGTRRESRNPIRGIVGIGYATGR